MNYDIHWKKENKPIKQQLNIIADATISSKHIANGKNVPLIIVDTVDHPEIEHTLVAHTTVQTGHIATIWGKSMDNNFITLQFTLLDPVPGEFYVALNIQKQGILIDLIINTQLLYLQPGKEGDRLSNTMDSPRLLMEVPSTHFLKEWQLIFEQVMTKHFKKMRLTKREAQNAAKNLYKELGILRDFRMK